MPRGASSCHLILEFSKANKKIKSRCVSDRRKISWLKNLAMVSQFLLEASKVQIAFMIANLSREKKLCHEIPHPSQRYRNFTRNLRFFISSASGVILFQLKLKNNPRPQQQFATSQCKFTRHLVPLPHLQQTTISVLAVGEQTINKDKYFYFKLPRIFLTFKMWLKGKTSKVVKLMS